MLKSDPSGHICYTDNNAYSGDNSRAVIKADNSLYYTAGNGNSGNLSKSQVGITTLGFNLSHAVGAELIVPGQTPLVPPNNNMLGFFVIGTDKPGKDTNFRGITIFNDTVYVTKGSGGNGVNTVYQIGTPGTLPTPANAPRAARSTNRSSPSRDFLRSLPFLTHQPLQPLPALVGTIRSASGSPTPPPCTFATRAT